MEQLIQRLIEVDKQARARVSKAKKDRVNALETIEARRKEIEAENEKAFETLLSEEAARAEAQKQTARQEVEATKQALLAHLDSLFEENGEQWVDRIVSRVLDDGI